MDVHVAILAAGKGTRMKSTWPKVLHRAAGIPLIEHVLAAADAIGPVSTTIVVGHMSEVVERRLAHRPATRFVVQEPQLGTGHALLQTEGALAGAQGTLLLLSGDVPLLKVSTLKCLIERHEASGAAATVVTADVADPAGYGRIVRDLATGRVVRIVEDRDATSSERAIQEINSGIYAFALAGLFEAVRRIGHGNAQHEYYLPDLVAIFRGEGRNVESFKVGDANEIRGVNSREELATVTRIMRNDKNAALMAAGVTLEDPATAYIDRDVTIGADTVIHPCVTLEGTTTIGAGCEIHSGVRIVNSQIGDRAIVFNHCVLVEARVSNDARIGPFAHLRKDADVRAGAKVGNFVELKNTVLGPGSKSMHLTYLGDARIGEKVNVGAGTITCNYDGEKKRQTHIEDGAFIGSDTQLIAPVTVGRNAYVGSGTTIREDVPPDALAVSAGKQRNIEHWVTERRKKLQKTEG
ncbi:MAG TPA: bifunctional UDP-N-acetylglucosamine diphosphorylase/glucosamine-1-phosphate N-acetyltransferase GlmU [Vicinamibacterales bacterium]|jgi:bifunctional UDP-N-acetylglucosamine pyrophosphorylase/glucosamine-1-phosphate N-acetyltransferase